jgi:DNA polymerase
VPELALGYQGGVGAFQQFSNSYQVNMVDYWPTIQSTLDARFIARAHQNYSKWGFESDINQEAWLASEAIKLAWRDRHPATVALWHSCQKAASQALRTPGQVVAAGPRLRFKFVKHSGHPWLLVGMPSKRFMAYFDPKMDGDKLSYMGIEKRHGAPRWERIGTYGGKLVENLCQSLGRDVLTDAMPAVEQAGYRIVLSVHDELVTEAPDTADYSEGDLSRILATNPSWATGLPLAAAGFEAQRYRKD